MLVEKYQDRIYSAVLNYVYDREDAIDVTQEAFIKAYAKLKTFRAGSSFYTWIYRVAVNAAIDFLRKRKTRYSVSLDDDKFTEIGFEPVSTNSAYDPEKVVINVEQATVLRKAIATLPEKLRVAIVLYDVEGLSQEEVAEILDVPIGTVKSRVSRARADLRHKLSRYAGELL